MDVAQKNRLSVFDIVKKLAQVHLNNFRIDNLKEHAWKSGFDEYTGRKREIVLISNLSTSVGAKALANPITASILAAWEFSKVFRMSPICRKQTMCRANDSVNSR